MKHGNFLKLALMASGIGAFFTGCSGVSGGVAGIGDTTAIKNRTAVEKLAYMGGSAVYNAGNPSLTQLAKNAVVAVRLGKVEKNDLGGGVISYKNSTTDYSLGFIEVSDVDSDGISFSYYTFGDDSDSYSLSGSFTLKNGQSCDLNGDGEMDVKYEKGRNAVKNTNWLTFINGEEKDTSSLFAVVPGQYENGTYPAGLIGINSDGRSIVTKNDVRTNSRAAVANIAYGDYVIDSDTNSCQIYVGPRIKGGSARALTDSELETINVFKSEDAEALLFKPQEFDGGYSVYELLNRLPASIVTDSHAESSVADAVEYLNGLIIREDFIENLVAAESGDAVEEIKMQLAMQPVSCEEERVLFNRHSLALVYPDLCPDFSLASTSMSVVFPWLYVSFGDLPTEEEIESNARNIALAEDNARSAGGSGKADYTEEYKEYLAKRKAIEDGFDKLADFDVAPLIGSIIGNGHLASFMNQTKVSLKVGVDGHLNIAFSNISARIKLCVLASVEVQDKLSYNIKGTSLFSKDKGEITSVEDYKKKFPNSSMSEDEIKKTFMLDEDATKKEWGINKWYFNFSNDGQTVNTLGCIYPSADAKDFHVSFAPVKVLPVVVTFDGKFDILTKMNAVIEFKNLYAGGICVYGYEAKFGADWGFRRWYTIAGKRIAPKITSFYFDTYANGETIAQTASYFGPKEKDESKTLLGGGIMAQIIPVVQVRGGIGIGGDAYGIKADFTVGVKFTVAAIAAYIGLSYQPSTGDFMLVTETGMNVVSTLDIDLQLYIDPPLVSAKRWHKDIYKIGTLRWQIFKLRTEGFRVVKREGFKALEESSNNTPSGNWWNDIANEVTKMQGLKVL